MRKVNQPNTQASVTIGDLLKQGSELLSKSHIKAPSLDSRLILSFLISHTLEQLLINKNQAVLPAIARRFFSLIRRRVQHVPIAYLIKSKEFYGIEFVINNRVLIPRPESESLINAALQEFSTNQKISILDLGTGSGCLIVTLLLSFPKAHGIAVDISAAAIALAKKNAESCGVKDRISFIEKDWRLYNIQNKFDLIISNPPYIGSTEFSSLSDDVKKYEPISALYGGNDGLQDYRELLPIVKRLLKPSGVCILECGKDQHLDIEKIAKTCKLAVQKYQRDLSETIRCLVLQNL